MGFLDKIKSLGDRFKKKTPTSDAPAPRPKISLDAAKEEEWVEQLIKELGLQKQFDTFSKESDDLRKQGEELVKKFTDEGILSAIPERARTVNALHGKEYAEQVEKVLKAAVFTDLFDFNQEHSAFTEAANQFQESTGKSAAVLKEFMYDELKDTQEIVQKLEDACLAFLQKMEDAGFDAVEQMHGAFEKMHALEERQGKFVELLKELQKQFSENKEKRSKFQQKMKEQRGLIRNPEAREALDKLTGLEQEMDDLVSKHERTASDIAKYFKKHKLSIPTAAEHVLKELPKQSERFLAENGSDVSAAFDALADQLEQDGRGNLGNLISRLRDNASTATQDGARVKEILPEQQEFKKNILRDVAAINIYDQQQFLLRAGREKRELDAKIAYVKEQLNPAKRVALDRDIKDAAIKLGAVITGTPKEVKMDYTEDIEETTEEPKEETPEALTEDAQEEIADKEQTAVENEEDVAIAEAEETIDDVDTVLSNEEELSNIHFDDKPAETPEEKPAEAEPEVFEGKPEEIKQEEPEPEEPTPEVAPEHEETPEVQEEVAAEPETTPEPEVQEEPEVTPEEPEETPEPEAPVADEPVEEAPEEPVVEEPTPEETPEPDVPPAPEEPTAEEPEVTPEPEVQEEPEETLAEPETPVAEEPTPEVAPEPEVQEEPAEETLAEPEPEETPEEPAPEAPAKTSEDFAAEPTPVPEEETADEPDIPLETVPIDEPEEELDTPPPSEEEEKKDDSVQ